MKDLILGLGNPLMSDDGVGVRAAELLAGDPEIVLLADVVAGGSDLLRYMDLFEGRRRVILIDAADSRGGEGDVSIVEDVPGVNRTESVHALSAPDALDLMRRVMPSLGRTRFTWVLVRIRSAVACPELSQKVTAALPRVVELVRQELIRLIRANSGTGYETPN